MNRKSIAEASQDWGISTWMLYVGGALILFGILSGCAFFLIGSLLGGPQPGWQNAFDYVSVPAVVLGFIFASCSALD